MAGTNSVCEFEDFDPRSEHLWTMDGYSAYFRNVCLNLNGISKAPIFQAFKPGNTSGLNAENDCLEETHEEILLKRKTNL